MHFKQELDTIGDTAIPEQSQTPVTGNTNHPMEEMATENGEYLKFGVSSDNESNAQIRTEVAHEIVRRIHEVLELRPDDTNVIQLGDTAGIYQLFPRSISENKEMIYALNKALANPVIINGEEYEIENIF